MINLNYLKPKGDNDKKIKKVTSTNKEKSKKSDNGLKRPTTPYFLFCKEQHDELKKKRR